MQKKLTITVDGEEHAGLRAAAADPGSENGYRAMAADEEREAEALEWAEGLVGDVADERW
jgi:hypothetical protein